MIQTNDTAQKISLMERQINNLQILNCLLLTLGAAAILILSMRPATAHAADGILRTRGLIIEDASGRERILIGAPIPAAANRVRTDEARARESWAGRYPDPDRYMGFYKGYNHETNGILILDDHGYDRLALGDPVPDPNVGKRIGPSTGMIINDEHGNERSGYGLLKVGDRYRVVLGLDSAQGREGLTLGLTDEGTVGMTVRDAKGSAWTGSDGVHVTAAGNDGKPIQ
jgi:hypothetical protein